MTWVRGLPFLSARVAVIPVASIAKALDLH
jgi:hypothetical protein